MHVLGLLFVLWHYKYVQISTPLFVGWWLLKLGVNPYEYSCIVFGPAPNNLNLVVRGGGAKPPTKVLSITPTTWAKGSLKTHLKFKVIGGKEIVMGHPVV